MYFKINDVIELKDKSYLVEDVTIHDDVVYSKVRLYSAIGDETFGDDVVISAVLNDDLFIKEESDDNLISAINFK